MLLRVMTSTNERLLKSFSEAISAEAPRDRRGYGAERVRSHWQMADAEKC